MRFRTNGKIVKMSRFPPISPHSPHFSFMLKIFSYIFYDVFVTVPHFAPFCRGSCFWKRDRRIQKPETSDA